MADNDETQPQAPESPATTPAATTSEQPKKKKLTLEIDEVDTSELLERKISA